MKLLLKKAKIYQSFSPFHLQTKDLLVESGIIKQIADDINSSDAQLIEASGLCVSAGWFDTGVQICDPGFEHHEDLMTSLNAAKNGGFSAVGVLPNTLPVVDSKSQVEYLINRSKTHLVEVHPIGALSSDTDGKNISEMYDMHLSGAIAFSDGYKTVQSANLIKKSLLYTDRFNSTVITRCEDETIANDGLVNESTNTIYLGMKTRPALAEVLHVQRNIELLKYTGGKLHISCVSCKDSVEAIRKAKSEGLNVTADVALANVVFSDESLRSFDANFKVLPVIRTKEDQSAIVKGIEDGTIDFITSNHQPKDLESKDLEFERSAFGMSTIETMLPALVSSGLSIETIVKSLSENARSTFGLTIPEIKEGVKANITVFSTEAEVVLNKSFFQGCKSNTPFLNRTMKGKVIDVIKS